MTTRISIVDVGDIGLVQDRPAHALPPNAWTAAKNIRFSNGVASPTGKSTDVLGTLQIEPHWLHYTVSHWVYAGEKSASTLGVWAINQAGTHTELTTGAGVVPAWTSASNFSGGNINGLTIIATGTDHPVYWLGNDAATEKTIWLPWDASDDWSTKNWTARAIRPHKRWLFALGPTEAGTDYPTRIRNSAAAPPGAIPATWDDTDATNDAAFVDDPAADKYPFVDGASLGDEFVAATQQTIWIGQATGDVDAPFRFRKAFNEAGALSTDCMVTYERQQYILTHEDLVVHDGSQMRSMLDQTNRKWLFNNIDTDNFERAFLHFSRLTRELMVCFPEQGADTCTKALVLRTNLSDRPGVRDLPEIRAIDTGDDFAGAVPLIYSTSTFSYAASNFPYTTLSAVRNREDRLAVSPNDLTGLLCLKHYPLEIEGTQTSFVERSHITFPGEARAELQDARVLRCTAIYPTFNRAPDGDLNVYLGTANAAGATMAWHGPQVYNAATTRTGRVTFREQGRYLGVRFETTDGADWGLSGYDMDIVPLGYRS